jgi:hypothetical protein
VQTSAQHVCTQVRKPEVLYQRVVEVEERVVLVPEGEGALPGELTHGFVCVCMCIRSASTPTCVSFDER